MLILGRIVCPYQWYLCKIGAEKLKHATPSSIVQAHSAVFLTTCLRIAPKFWAWYLILCWACHPVLPRAWCPILLFCCFSDHMFTDCGDFPPIFRSFAAGLALCLLSWSCPAGLQMVVKELHCLFSRGVGQPGWKGLNKHETDTSCKQPLSVMASNGCPR